MRRALRLAGRGVSGQIADSSPRVGCLIVCEEGNIVGEGFYSEDNGTHAVLAALKMADIHARNSTVYITLEPNASGTDAIIAAGVRRVVATMIDPNQHSAGERIGILRENGIRAEVGLMEQSARQLNRSYIERFVVGTEQKAVVPAFNVLHGTI